MKSLTFAAAQLLKDAKIFRLAWNKRKKRGFIMRNTYCILRDVAEIYRKYSTESEEYLKKVRKLKKEFGAGSSIVYCWFYSVPQKWSQVEPKIFQLMEYTNLFDLETILSIPAEKIVKALNPIIFHKELAFQLKNFSHTIKKEYSSWECFAKVLERESIFAIFRRIRKEKGVRVTFKNLAAMKSFVGMTDDILIPDIHVAKVMGICRNELNSIRTHEILFKRLLEKANEITKYLRTEFNDISTIKWSLGIWFYKAGIKARELLTYNRII